MCIRNDNFTAIVTITSAEQTEAPTAAPAPETTTKAKGKDSTLLILNMFSLSWTSVVSNMTLCPVFDGNSPLKTRCYLPDVTFLKR